MNLNLFRKVPPASLPALALWLTTAAPTAQFQTEVFEVRNCSTKAGRRRGRRRRKDFSHNREVVLGLNGSLGLGTSPAPPTPRFSAETPAAESPWGARV